MSEYTWSIASDEVSGALWIENGYGETVCDLYINDRPVTRFPNSDKNAPLIAAAPDLHAALTAMCDAYTDVLDGLNMTEDVTGRLGNAHRDAIDSLLKARGETP